MNVHVGTFREGMGVLAKLELPAATLNEIRRKCYRQRQAALFRVTTSGNTVIRIPVVTSRKTYAPKTIVSSRDFYTVVASDVMPSVL